MKKKREKFAEKMNSSWRGRAQQQKSIFRILHWRLKKKKVIVKEETLNSLITYISQKYCLRKSI